MKMHRSPFLGALAFYPVVALAIITILPETYIAISGDAGALWNFLDMWWFGLVVATVIAVTIFFSVHALRRTAVRWWRRALWLVGFWLLGPIVLPAYWWADSHAT